MNRVITVSRSFSPIWPWPTPTRAFGADLLHEIRQRINRLDAVVNNIDLAAALQLKIDRILDDDGLELHDDGLNRQAVARRRLDNRHVPQPAERHVERARNRRRGHRHHVDLFLDLLEALFVRHAETLLFVDDHQTEILKLDVLRKQPVRADHDIHLAALRDPRRPSSVPSA